MDVNVDYISVIRNVEGHVRFIKEQIEKHDALISELKEMLNNPNRTVLDIQSRMDIDFREVQRRYIDYVFPFPYGESYVTGVSYPSVDYDEFCRNRDEKEESIRSRCESNYSYLKEDNPEEFTIKMEEAVKKNMNNYSYRLKQVYLQNCIRFCRADGYDKLLRNLKSDNSVKMWSTENVGWTDISYSITDDIVVSVHTNFGYGQSSYFHLKLTYMGIDIVPYSFCVKYYYADVIDIKRYTRNYCVDRKSWDFAFEFVEDTASVAEKGEEFFAKTFIINEINEMVVGLRNILSNPEAYVSRFVNHKKQRRESLYYNVREMNDDEIIRMGVYNKEMSMVFQAEKISGALDFLDKLSELKPIYNSVQKVIEEIRSIAKSLLPKLESNIISVSRDVKRQLKYESTIIQSIDALEARKITHDRKIDDIYKTKKSKDCKYCRYMAEDEYKESHFEYRKIVSDISSAKENLCKVSEDRYQREGFLYSLEECQKKILTIEIA